MDYFQCSIGQSRRLEEMAQDDIYPDFPDSELSHPIDLPGQQTTEHQPALALQERLRTPVALGGQEDHVAHRNLDGRLCPLPSWPSSPSPAWLLWTVTF